MVSAFFPFPSSQGGCKSIGRLRSPSIMKRRATRAAQRSPTLLLAGDIGGTNARLRLYTENGRHIVHETTLPSRGSRSLEALLAPYLRKRGARVAAAVFGIAGPVEDGIARTTNLAWVVNERSLSAALGIPRVKLVNDMTAIAVGARGWSGRAGPSSPPGARRSMAMSR